MNPLILDPSVRPSAPLTDDERDAIQKRLAQIDVAIGHPSWTAEQLAAFVREQASLQRALAADDSQ